jgi:hypothetical protein
MPWWIRPSCIKPWWLSLLLCAGAASAGPVEFGTAELNAAIDARNFKYKPKIAAELNLEPPETFRIEPYAAGGGHITGGDLRGLMYGLLEAAQQMRATGRLKLTHGVPALALRGVRIAARSGAPSLVGSAWLSSNDFWQEYFTAMARSRFNRLELAFDSAPQPEALPSLRNIAQIAQQFGVDVAIGFGAPSVPAIEQLLRDCPAIRAIVLHGDLRPDPAALLRALHDAGRRVVLELPDNDRAPGLIEAAGQSGAPLRLYADYSETAINPRPRDSYWDIDAARGVDAVNGISGAGFQVDSPIDASGRPALDAIAAWGRSGYSRPAP